ncbi:MAG: helix-turn-helix domain-containing protein [Psychroserpens sp.]|nr:helix-turn-helix domain-containing protein [Psychroserpens sp.]MBO6607413.1 helix-turn-helix domain-containing protein [Psychroserpens sp.]MBO6654509.1 helix-turn-helix domain-containing protein [Psychroserpens sp.]MBO6681142.1 helix-turn-helix domain-containing protein [Psychroserpens sp.]MBO6749901.1 helix-turn-helix domain-containing protein [Psychroserpens sp.]MBO6916111.1 helix-turn-helix domain-containing protein [Psychroserpens sp.]
MSSNIRINRICQFCNEEFVAKTTVTKYCGDNCAKKAYKQRIRLKKLEKSDEDTLTKINIPHERLRAKEFLTIADVCLLLSVSRWTVWRKIKEHKIIAKKIGSRVLIRRADLDNYLNEIS